MPVPAGNGTWVAEQPRNVIHQAHVNHLPTHTSGFAARQPARRQRSGAAPRRQRRLSRNGATQAVAYSTDYAWAPTKQSTGQVEKYIFRAEGNVQVIARVERQPWGYVVNILLSDLYDSGDDVAIIWGTYRSSAAKWFNPDEITPAGSSPSQIGKGLRSKLHRGGSGQHEIQFNIGENLAPVFLGFQLELRNGHGQRTHHGPLRGPEHFAVPIGLAKGDPLNYGATLVSTSADGNSFSVNFAVASRNATAMSLCLARRDAEGAARGYVEVALDPLVNRKGDAWHARLDGLKDLQSLFWGWRADADVTWDLGNRFHSGQVMLDPYAPVAAKVQLPDSVNVPPPQKGLAPNNSANGASPPALLGCLGYLVETPPQRAPKPGTSMEDTMILEVDVPSFTGGNTVTVPAHNKGKYPAILAAITQMKAMGVTAVMFTPVTAGGAGLGPFGRAPFSFFAPEPQFASGLDVAAAQEELRTVVRELQSNGIEVYFQVEYSLTGEGWDDDASAVSLRGLDAAVYYRAKGVLNCGHSNVRSLILDSLRHWARSYNADGFCFVNAETLALDRDGNVLDNPPLAEAIANDSELRALKLIAWSADDALLPRSGERGFPHWGTWLERNKRFTDDIRAFFTGHGPQVAASAIATRICGSPDLFSARWGDGLPGGLATGRRASFGLNAASVLDSTPLSAVASQLLPHEAPIGQDMILKQTLLFASIISQGTPVIGADVLDDPRLVEFVGRVWSLRRRFASLLTPITFDIERDLRWYGADYGGQPDWDNGSYLAYGIYEDDGTAVYIAYNPYSGPVPAILPPPPFGYQWRRAVDTSDIRQAAPVEREWLALTASDYTLGGKAALMLIAAPQPKPKLPSKPATATATVRNRPATARPGFEPQPPQGPPAA